MTSHSAPRKWSAPVFRQNDVCRCVLEQRPDLVFREARDAAADLGEHESLIRVLPRGGEEAVAAGLERCLRDFFEAGCERRERLALAGQAFTDAFLRAELFFGEPGRAPRVRSALVRSEYENSLGLR